MVTARIFEVVRFFWDDYCGAFASSAAEKRFWAWHI